MRILLLGYQGYVGQGLAHYFKCRGVEFLGWGKKENINSLSRNYLEKNKINLIVNCATVMERSLTSKMDLQSQSYQVNVEGVLNLLRQISGTDIKLIHISTKDVFGSVYNESNIIEEDQKYFPKFFVDESYPYSPQSVYAKTKLISEFLVESSSSCNIIRLSTCYTSFDHERGNWLTFFIKKSLSGESINISHNGKQFRDMLHSDDLGSLIEKMFERNLWGVKVNVGGGIDNIHSLLDVLSLIQSPSKLTFSEGDDFGFAFENSLAEKTFVWSPQVKFTDIVDEVKSNVVSKISGL